MAISKRKKVRISSGYTQQLKDSQAIILTDYRGLTVASMTELRQKLRDIGSSFHVTKNTLFRRALVEAGIPIPEEQLKGPTAVGFITGDVAPVVKAFFDFAVENEALQVKGVIWGAAFIDREGAKALINLPPREVLLGQLLGVVQGPMANMVGTITAPLREIVQVLAARGQQGDQAAA
ncbi:MAG: 50S ribosomal protein L10 [Anaerolineae bacterium]|nr:50S ribosomal protein L10 [Anaerolineae bacterium]